MGDSDGDTLTNVIKVDYSFDYDEFGDISQDAKDLISNLLQRDKRYVALVTRNTFIRYMCIGMLG